MKEEIKKLWVEALRSGGYKQHIGYLREDDKFCCLGVLCDLHSKQTGTEWGGNARQIYMGDGLMLPDEVQEWAGLTATNPRIDPADVLSALSNFNDGCSGKQKCTFNQIADLIEKHL